VAFKNDGTAEAWGQSGRGGDASNVDLTNVVDAMCGTYACVAVKNDGTAEAWGHSSFGGDASSVDLTNVAHAMCGGNACVAVKNDGTAEAWGRSSNGGDASDVDLTNVVHAMCGYYACVAVKNDGTAEAWGSSGKGGDASSVDLTNVQTTICSASDGAPTATSLPSLAPTMPTCDAFLNCGDDAIHIPSAVTIHGNDFESCCRCQFGSNLLWGAHANGTFHEDSNKVEMWLEVLADVDMQRISWEDAQNDDLQYTKGSPGSWQFRNGSSECRAQYALVQDLNTFFGAASHFTYDRSQDVLEGMFDFEADRCNFLGIDFGENPDFSMLLMFLILLKILVITTCKICSQKESLNIWTLR